MKTKRVDFTRVDVDRQKQYETRWVWYHAVLAVELLICNILLLLLYLKL
jgi:hypothetical protein